MGLDLELFETEVPEELVCGLCHKVLVHPVHSTCSHLFCNACLKRTLKTEKEITCPTCNAHLKKKTVQPSVDVKLRLLNLPMHCSHKCGKVCTLAELPDHVSEDCPNAPVPCPHAHRGCKMTVKRAELQEHVQECDFRHVLCEACGQRTIFIDLFTHQSRKRCLEKKLRQQLIKAVRVTNTEVKQHKRSLDRQHLRLEQQQRQRVMDRFRQTATTTAKDQRQRNHPNNSSEGNSSNDSEYETPSTVGTESTGFDPQQHVLNNADVFLTSSQAVDDAISERAVALNTPSPSRTTLSVATCRNCKRQFRDHLNSPNSCRWHAGPIIKLFGGTCYSCGRLDYQKGCMMGYHEI